MRYTRLLLGGLVALLGVILTADAQIVNSPNKKTLPANLKTGLTNATKEKQETIEKLLKTLGPAISEQIRAGREVDIPSLGKFSIVRVPEYKDLVDGRPTTIGAKNYVVFVATEALNKEANAAGTVPIRTIPTYEFKVSPRGEDGQRTPGTRNLGTRTK
jgi:nucleoid DNA-binding protein